MLPRCFLVLVWFTFAASASPEGSITLKAARRPVDLVKRSEEIVLTNLVTLSYAEQTSLYDVGPRLTSTFQMSSDQPTLFLEDFDHLLQEVECEKSTMSIKFRSAAKYKSACDQTRDLIQGWIVSSHFTCSQEGAHAVFQVMGITNDDRSLRLLFEIKESTVRSAFRDVDFNLDHTADGPIVHSHGRLFRRQKEDENGITSTFKPKPTERPSATISTALPADISQEDDLGFSFDNTTFKGIPFDLGCRKCSGTGKVKITASHIRFDWGNKVEDSVFETGSLELNLTGFSLSIGLKASPKPGEKSVQIFKKTLVGIEVPFLVSIGIKFGLDLEFKAKLNQSVALGFGFDVTVPDSSIRADIVRPNTSGIVGFNPTVTAQILRSNISNVDVWMFAGVKPSFVMGVKILGVGLDVGPFLSLPHLTLNASQLPSTEVGANCKAKEETIQQFKDSYKNLTHVQYGVGIGGGIDIDLGWFGDYPITFASKQLEVATQCLVYKSDGPSIGLAYATSALAEITRTLQSSPATLTSKAKGSASNAAPSSWGLAVVVFFGVACLIS